MVAGYLASLTSPPSKEQRHMTLDEIRSLLEADHAAGKHANDKAEQAACHVCTPDEVLGIEP